VQRFLGEIEAAEEAYERGEHAPRFAAVNRIDRRADASVYVTHWELLRISFYRAADECPRA
jgi:hypothetical protein